MLEHLNTRTRHIVGNLCARQQVELGSETFGPYLEKESHFLFALATNFSELQGLGGQELAERFVELFEVDSGITNQGEERAQER